MPDVYFDSSYNSEAGYIDYSAGVKDSMLRALIAEQLGTGIHRHVYALRGSKDLVIKVEPYTGSFANVMEYEVWQAVQYHENAKWFAPVYGIDHTGSSLVMARTKPITEKEFSKLKELPWFFTDIKPENFGKLNGRIVCHDYGLHNLITHGVCSGKKKKNPYAV